MVYTTHRNGMLGHGLLLLYPHYISFVHLHPLMKLPLSLSQPQIICVVPPKSKMIHCYSQDSNHIAGSQIGVTLWQTATLICKKTLVLVNQLQMVIFSGYVLDFLIFIPVFIPVFIRCLAAGLSFGAQSPASGGVMGDGQAVISQ